MTSTKMTRRDFVKTGLAAGAVLTASTTTFAGLSMAMANGTAKSEPDFEFIDEIPNGYRVRPGAMVDGIQTDHCNLSWALNHAPDGGIVKLVEGDYKLDAGVLVTNFNGTFAGAGTGKTRILNSDRTSIAVSGDAALPFPRIETGYATKASPTFFLFYKSPGAGANSISVKGMTCSGSGYGEPWALGSLKHPEQGCFVVLNTIDWSQPERAQIPTRQDATFKHIEVDGHEDLNSIHYGRWGCGCSCIVVYGSVVLDPNYDGSIGNTDGLGPHAGIASVTKAPGNVRLTNCTFRNCRFGPAFVGLKDGALTLAHNKTRRCRAGCMNIVDTENCDINVGHNDLVCQAFFDDETGAPSSLGCIFGFEGLFATIGFPINANWSPNAQPHPVTGIPVYKPDPSSLATAASRWHVHHNSCEYVVPPGMDAPTPGTTCANLNDNANSAAMSPSKRVLMQLRLEHNSCAASATCVTANFLNGSIIKNNECDGREICFMGNYLEEATIRENNCHGADIACLQLNSAASTEASMNTCADAHACIEVNHGNEITLQKNVCADSGSCIEVIGGNDIQLHENMCRNPETDCISIAEGASGVEVSGNRCTGAENCLVLDNVPAAKVTSNLCRHSETGIRVITSPNPPHIIADNHYVDVGCDVRIVEENTGRCADKIA